MAIGGLNDTIVRALVPSFTAGGEIQTTTSGFNAWVALGSAMNAKFAGWAIRSGLESGFQFGGFVFSSAFGVVWIISAFLFPSFDESKVEM